MSLDHIDTVEQGQGYNLSNLAHRAVTEMIRTRRLKGGEPIVEAKLAEVLGISRTPLREALQRLEGEGLVVKSGQPLLHGAACRSRRVFAKPQSTRNS